jgi:hypothetical protein
VVGHADTSSESMPNWDNNIDAVNPAPPPPTIRTGTSTSVMIDLRPLIHHQHLVANDDSPSSSVGRLRFDISQHFL